MPAIETEVGNGTLQFELMKTFLQIMLKIIRGTSSRYKVYYVYIVYIMRHLAEATVDFFTFLQRYLSRIAAYNFSLQTRNASKKTVEQKER